MSNPESLRTTWRFPYVPGKVIRYRRSKFSTRLPADHLYTAGHSWLRNEGGDLWQIGLTKFATRMLGEAVELDLEIGKGDSVETGQVVGWVEGFKAVTDIYVPLNGLFCGTNEALLEDMELLGRDSYDRGWIYSIEGKPDSDCLDVEGYMSVLDQTIDKMMGAPEENQMPPADSSVS